MKKQEKICRYRHEMKKKLDEIIIHKMEERSERQSRRMAVLNKYAVLLAAEENENQRHNIIAQRKAEMSAVEYDFLKREMELEREYISVRNEMDMVCLEMEDDEPTPPPIPKRKRTQSSNLRYGWMAADGRRRLCCGASSTSCLTPRARTYTSISRSTAKGEHGG
jgi:hypothetical protein